MKLFNWFRRTENTQTNIETKFRYLSPADRFADLLDTERLRADRCNMEFSLVVFHFPQTESRKDRFRSFATALQSRLRATDHAGLCGKRREDIGVIMWDSGTPGVRIFINDLRTALTADEFPEFDVYTYPTDPTFTDESDTPGAVTKRPKVDQASLHAPLPMPEVQSLEALFIKPLPMGKRAIDIVGAGVGLILLSPLLLLTALLIKLTSRGPVFFKQTRDGLGGRRFTIYKFRTMGINADAKKDELRRQSEQDGPAFKLTDDPRITRIGKYLRKTCIDELPQLWNVLIGDMTLVGPRPLDSREAAKITGFGRRRMEVTPGLTCIWQVDGKSRVTFTEWMRMDVRYIKTRSYYQDIKLIWRTAVAVVMHRASV